VIFLRIILDKKPKNPILIHGFPGFGLVGTIATEFLLEHLGVEQIGKITVEEMPAMVAVHKSKLVDPFGIFYNKKYNVVIVHAIAATQGFEWKLADFVLELSEKLQVQEIISLEGLAGSESENMGSFFYSNEDKRHQKLQKIGIKSLDEGIIMGVSAAILMKSDPTPLTIFFCETNSTLPDSKAAAKIIECLDKYLGLEVDYEPLLEQAQNFENKLQQILKKGAQAADLSEKKRMSYVG
jgi:uncharacterized protein